MVMMRRINKIFVHHSASSQQNTTRDMIDQWHKDRGWTGVGYHYVIEADGSMMMGRPFAKVGAHVKGHNKNSIGICVVGNYETEDFAMTPGQEQSLSVLLRGLLDEFDLDAGEIYGHMELGQTACPGQHLFKWVSDWRVAHVQGQKDKRTT
jgi:N-acetylmuramoyl-L-alanine amidase